MKPLGQQLSFEDLALRAIATDLPKIETPVFRWRKLVRRLEPLGVKPSRAAFQGVATVLADYADRNGRSCRPSVATLVRDSGFGERTVQYALRELVRWRVVEVVREGGRGKASEYHLICPGEKGVDKPRVHEQNGARDDVERVHGGAPQVRQREVCPEEEPLELDAASHFGQLALRVLRVDGLAESA